MEFYLGLIKYRPNVVWVEIYKLIKADSIENAEIKLKDWADKNVHCQDVLVIVTETI
jgi:hypothetical protein